MSIVLQHLQMSRLFQVTISEARVLPVTVECTSCSVLSHNTPVVLSGHCGQCDDQAQVNIINAMIQWLFLQRR